VEIARNYGVNLVVRSSWSDAAGTKLTSRTARPIGHGGLELGSPVDGVEQVDGQAILALSQIPDQPGIAARLFETLSDAGINVDLIIQATHEGTSNDITFTVNEPDLNQAREVTQSVLNSLGGELSSEGGLTKLSIRGAGIMGRPGIAGKPVQLPMPARDQPAPDRHQRSEGELRDCIQLWTQGFASRS
jgi:aspartate kinase